jgi:hypothetical protein
MAGARHQQQGNTKKRAAAAAAAGYNGGVGCMVWVYKGEAGRAEFVMLFSKRFLMLMHHSSSGFTNCNWFSVLSFWII